MKKRIRALAALLACALALGLAACGASAASTAAAEAGRVSNYASMDTASVEEAAPAGAAESGVDLGGEGAADAAVGRKIIRNATLDMEALDFDAACAALLKALDEAGGYVASTSAEQPSYEGALRRASYELRVPAGEYSAFLARAGEAGNVLSRQESTEDITAAYVDVEARLKSLRLQEERLYAMMEQAGELETLLAIQNQLTEVQYQIESYTAQQRTYDDLVDYSTVYVYLNEVRRVTENPETFPQRIGAAFSESWRNFGDGAQNFAVAFVYLLPLLLVLAALGLVVGLVIRAATRRSARRRGPLPAAPQPQTPPVQTPPETPGA